jgi:hypothetical protein
VTGRGIERRNIFVEKGCGGNPKRLLNVETRPHKPLSILDQPCAALIKDMKARGLLSEPYSEPVSKDGRRVRGRFRR